MWQVASMVIKTYYLLIIKKRLSLESGKPYCAQWWGGMRWHSNMQLSSDLDWTRKNNFFMYSNYSSVVWVNYFISEKAAKLTKTLFMTQA